MPLRLPVAHVFAVAVALALLVVIPERDLLLLFCLSRTPLPPATSIKHLCGTLACLPYLEYT
jgi:hypothetical protein